MRTHFNVTILFTALCVFLFIGISLSHRLVGSPIFLTPWASVGGCGIFSKDSLIGHWQWVKSCPDTATVCITPAAAGYNKYLWFGSDSIFAFKNAILVAVTPFDSTVITNQKGIAGVGTNNGVLRISLLGNLWSDTLWLCDTCEGEQIGCSCHLYVKDKNGILRRPTAIRQSGPVRYSDKMRYYTLRGERMVRSTGRDIRGAVLMIQHDPVNDRNRKVIGKIP